ncbi:MAG: elongation factor P maturation arginine rhamnosyltransferase EarP [Burkholderiaceae bacterium]
MDAIASPAPAPTRPIWDDFLRVIDNLGDIGVCWRFCQNLAVRGQAVRLWIDEPGALAWMAPGALEGRVPNVEVHHWTEPLPPGSVDAHRPADVWVEAFACDPATEWLNWLARRVGAGAPQPVWLNLEYMSAEGYVERCHQLPSPFSAGTPGRPSGSSTGIHPCHRRPAARAIWSASAKFDTNRLAAGQPVAF